MRHVESLRRLICSMGEDGSVPERNLEQGGLFKDFGEFEQASGRDRARDERVFEQFCVGRGRRFRISIERGGLPILPSGPG